MRSAGKYHPVYSGVYNIVVRPVYANTDEPNVIGPAVLTYTVDRVVQPLNNDEDNTLKLGLLGRVTIVSV